MGPVIKYPGAKWNIAEWIVGFISPHSTYLEPYFGSGAVYFNKKPSHVETINDLDGNVVNLFRVIRERPEELAAVIEMTPWSRQEYMELLTSATDENYLVTTGDPLEDARRLLIRMWQGFGSKTSDRCGWRHDIQGRKGTNCPKDWSRLPRKILEAANRLKQAQIECSPALKIIEAYRFPSVLIYADPPYPLSTRSKRMYKNEMTDEDHIQLLEALNQHPGPAMISGYACEMYDSRMAQWGWARHTKTTTSEFGMERCEVLWLNPIAAHAQSGLFQAR